MSKKLQKPGEKPERPGPYIERGERGGKIPGMTPVRIESGDSPLPPTHQPNRRWERISN